MKVLTVDRIKDHIFFSPRSGFTPEGEHGFFCKRRIGRGNIKIDFDVNQCPQKKKHYAGLVFESVPLAAILVALLCALLSAISPLMSALYQPLLLAGFAASGYVLAEITLRLDAQSEAIRACRQQMGLPLWGDLNKKEFGPRRAKDGRMSKGALAGEHFVRTAIKINPWRQYADYREYKRTKSQHLKAINQLVWRAACERLLSR